MYRIFELIIELYYTGICESTSVLLRCVFRQFHGDMNVNSVLGELPHLPHYCTFSQLTSQPVSTTTTF